MEKYKDDAHHEQDLAPCIIDAESINEYDNGYDNADDAQEWDQPPGAAVEEHQECEQTLGVIGKESPHKEENHPTVVMGVHNAKVPKKLHIAPGSKFNMDNSTRAHSLQPVKPDKQGTMNKN